MQHVAYLTTLPRITGHAVCFICITQENWACSMHHVLAILPRRTGHATCFIYITQENWACSMQYVLSLLPRRTGHAACSMFYLYYLGELGMQHVACFIYITQENWACSMQHVHITVPCLIYIMPEDCTTSNWSENSESIKGNESVISSDLSCTDANA